MKENPQGFSDNIEEDEIEKNSGIEFPGDSYETYLNKTFYNH